MGQRRLRTVLANFLQNLKESRHLAADAYSWSLPGARGRRPHISSKRRESMVELAFLRAFLGWEMFLEESFILYLSGQKPPRGRLPYRYTHPPNYAMAVEWVVPEGRTYAKWNESRFVIQRAERHFRNGEPFASPLRRNSNALEEARHIRNAVAHESAKAQSQFEQVVRTNLGTLPHNLTVGGFLGTLAPKTAPPITFLELYVSKIEAVAQQIVRA